VINRLSLQPNFFLRGSSRGEILPLNLRVCSFLNKAVTGKPTTLLGGAGIFIRLFRSSHMAAPIFPGDLVG
jgi:hypothetical protein